MKAALVAIAVAGCSSLGGPRGADGDGGMGAGDAPGGPCEVSIQITPAMPEAGDHVHAAAVVSNPGGVATYTWTVDGVTSMAYEAADQSAIGFDVPTATAHTVDVAVTGTGVFCPSGMQDVNVITAGGGTALYRLRVVPPSGVAAPFEGEILVHAGTATNRDVALDPGEELAGTVASGALGVPAYVQLVPTLGPTIDAFSALATGTFEVRVALVPYQVIVQPELAGLAPRAFAWTPSSGSSFAVDAGSTITGSVVAGTTPLANATVQLTSGGVPSTMATTAADGSFTLHAAFAAGAQVTATVVPPATSGLARLVATSAFDLTKPLAIAYAFATPCDLGGEAVQRGGVAKAGAQVTVVGSAGTAGTIDGVTAAGSVVATATTNGSGVLPSTLVPRATGLFAIVQVAPGDLAVAAIDTSACAAQTIVAPAQLSSSGVVTTLAGTPLAGVQVEATPTGPLALATLAPVGGTTGPDGSVTLSLASGGTYDIRLVDPSARGAPLAVSALTATMKLGPALAISGTVNVIGGTNTVAGAAVEVLCASCTGLDADRPIAQAATDVQGNYVLAVPDPGSM